MSSTTNSEVKVGGTRTHPQIRVHCWGLYSEKAKKLRRVYFRRKPSIQPGMVAVPLVIIDIDSDMLFGGPIPTKKAVPRG